MSESSKIIKNKNIQKILYWIDKQNFEFKFSNNNYIDFSKSIVCIHNKLNLKNSIYTLLHECGHLITYKSKNYFKEFKYLNKAENNSFYINTNIYKYQILKEEIKAWENGKKLAKKLKIKINTNEYEKYASKQLMTYIKWINNLN